MKLAALTEGLQYTLLQGTMEKDVNSLIYFSEEAEAGSAFFAIPGSEKNGLAYVQAAQERGVRMYFSSRNLSFWIPFLCKIHRAGLLRFSWWRM